MDAIKTLGLEVTAEKAAKTIQDMSGGLATLERAGIRAADSTKSLGSEANKQADAVAKQDQRVRAATQALHAGTDAFDKQTGRMRASIDEWNKFGTITSKNANAFRDASFQILSSTNAQFDATTATGKAMHDLQDEYRKTATEAIKEADAVIAAANSQKSVASSADQADAAFKKLRPGVAALTSQIAGFSSTGTTLLSVLAQMGVGAVTTVGVLAGAAAIGYVYDKLTQKSRAQAKEQRDQTKALEDFLKLKAQGAAGSIGLQTDAALKTVNDSEKAIAAIQTRISSLTLQQGLPGQSLESLGLSKQLATLKGQLAEQKQLFADGNKERLRLINEDNANTKRSQDQGLAQLITANLATAAERKRAVQTVAADQAELARLNREALSDPTKAKDTVGQRTDLAAGIKAMTEALNPAKLQAAADRLAGVRDEVTRLKEAAASFGKEASIDQRISKITDSLNAMEKKFPSLSKQIAVYRTEAIAAGEAMKVGALASVTTEIENQQKAAQDLFAAVKSGAGSYSELSAAKQADLEIAQREATLGTTLGEALRQKIRDTKELNVLTQQAKGTADLQQQADAIRAETDAIKSGASTRATYAVDLLYEKNLKDALQITNEVERASRIKAVEALHDEGVARAQLVDGIQKHEQELKKAETAADRAERDAQRLANVFRNDLLGAIQELTSKGSLSLDNLFDKVGGLSTKLIGQTGTAIQKVQQQIAEINKISAGKQSIDETLRLRDAEEQLRKLKSIQTVAGYASVVTGGFSAGYGVGSTTTNKGAAAGGGALSGAATGAAIGTSIEPGFGTAVGAIVGAVAGLVGGLLGSANKGRQAAAQMAIAQDQLGKSIDGIKASLSKDGLGSAVAQAEAQFDELRKATEAAYSGKKNEAERNRVLAELNGLEEKRLSQVREEYALTQTRMQQDDAVRQQIAAGDERGAAATAFKLQQERELADLRKSGASDESITSRETTLRAEAKKREADEARALSQFTQSNDVLALRSKGLGEEADAMQTQLDIQAKYEAAVKQFGDTAETSRYKMLLLADAERVLQEQREAEAKRVSRNVTDLANGARGFTDVRGAAEASLIEAQQRRYEDASTAAEKAAVAMYNVAEAADFYAKRAEADTRTTESLVSRVLATFNDPRATEDYTRTAQQRQETSNFAGESDFNKGFLQFTHSVENLGVKFQRDVEDGAKAITDKADAQIKANDFIAKTIRTVADEEIATIDKQIEFESKKFDALISAAQQQVGYAQQSVQMAEQQLALTQRAADAVNQYGKGFALSDASTLSPSQRAEEARRQFETQSALAAGGDRNAATGLGAIADAFLKESRNINASSTAYGADASLVDRTFKALGDKYSTFLGADTRGVDQAQASLLAAQSQVDYLQQIKQTTLDDLEFKKNGISKEADLQINKLGLLNDSIRDGIPALIAAFTNTAYEGFQQSVKALDGYETYAPVFTVAPRPETATETANANNLRVMAEKLSAAQTDIAALAQAVKALADTAGNRNGAVVDGLHEVVTTLNTTSGNLARVIDEAFA